VLAYTAQTTQRLLAEFWTPVDWPPYLPDLNSLGFFVCSVLKAKVHAMLHINLAALSPSIIVE
jgi:hypothetical protein